MAYFENNGTQIYYEEYGSGFPVLLFAPGGMRSAIRFWEKPWNPITALSPHFRVIAMDQRNAGQSTAPISAEDSWHTYTADHLGLLDHLQIERCHVLGGCIGGPYCFGVMQAAPDRVAAAVIQQTIGLDNNREAFYDMFDGWATNLLTTRQDVSQDDLNVFRSNMYDGDFLLNVDEAFVSQCDIPMLVLMGDDLYHPASISRRIAQLAPQATLVEHWKTPEVISQTVDDVIRFLKAHST